jgi:hypothetical protein
MNQTDEQAWTELSQRDSQTDQDRQGRTDFFSSRESAGLRLISPSTVEETGARSPVPVLRKDSRVYVLVSVDVWQQLHLSCR